MTKVLLIRLDACETAAKHHPRRCAPPFTLKYLEALLLQSGHYEVKFWDCFLHPISLEKLKSMTAAWYPQTVVLCFRTAAAQKAWSLAQGIKAQHQAIILGIGQEITWRHELYRQDNSPFDAVVRGEAEEAAFELLENLRKAGNGVIKAETLPYGVAEARLHLVTHLDRLPFPRYSQEELQSYYFLYPLKISRKVMWGHILSSRGCNSQCIFCSQVIRESYGKELRYRSAQNIAREIAELKSHGTNVISFDDDNFTSSPAHVDAVCHELIKQNIRIPWIAQSRIDSLDPELLPLMHQAGCMLLKLGVETGSPKILETLCKTTVSQQWGSKCQEVFSSARRAKIFTNALVMLGSPGEGRADAEQSLQLLTALQPDILQVHFFTPYPGSEIHQTLQNRIGEPELQNLFHYRPSNLKLSDLSRQELLEFRAKFYQINLSPKKILKHFLTFAGFYLFNSRILLELLSIHRIIRKCA